MHRFFAYRCLILFLDLCSWFHCHGDDADDDDEDDKDDVDDDEGGNDDEDNWT